MCSLKVRNSLLKKSYNIYLISLVNEVWISLPAEDDLDRPASGLELLLVEGGEDVSWRIGVEVILHRDVVSGQPRVNLVLSDEGSERRLRVKCECGGDLDGKWPE